MRGTVQKNGINNCMLNVISLAGFNDDPDTKYVSTVNHHHTLRDEVISFHSMT